MIYRFSNCLKVVYNHAPFEEYELRGQITALMKQILIGLVISGAVAVGVYYASMSLYAFSNIFNLSNRADDLVEFRCCDIRSSNPDSYRLDSLYVL